jgi:hypothetical protein
VWWLGIRLKRDCQQASLAKTGVQADPVMPGHQVQGLKRRDPNPARTLRSYCNPSKCRLFCAFRRIMLAIGRQV